ncbi:MAG: 16S rRNA (cytosine(967)-C(5))-methyltransferase [Gammaproteobacteria bacterium]|nr:16S rRNA (cytosine(967)-C(5))-methyltransferase RsmB [Gammaproteobacteria bacterium]PCH62578.1 MAG: 16S rRNA (cytosine(967)-C(5))-methyltransferase [Gammaproteobacteria bacterium]PCH64531.1 MAG: 16S rRNA (cytosine(967)-C(5))-methyltransferase [Gammaproteobacteria bacterium]
MNVRLQALNILMQVVKHNHSLDGAFDKSLQQQQTNNAALDAHTGLLKELCYGVMRWWPTLQAIEQSLLDKPLVAKHQDLSVLIWIGIYQLEYMRTADHAAVSETVACAQAIKKQWAKSLLNAVLRRFQRERGQLIPSLENNLVASTAHPSGLLATLQQAWPNDWRYIVEQNNARAPMSLRVNQRLISRTDYRARLEQAGIFADVVEHIDSALSLKNACPVETLPGFNDGLVSVQDAAAQLAATLLAPQSGQRVIDACAAPGGKTCHLLEQAPDIDLLAIDSKAWRLQRLEENLQRLSLSCHVQVADAIDLESWWDGQPVDRILLDAPCSGSGVIRRHPDIKWLRQEFDIEQLLTTQSELLRALWSTLKPGGVLLYATCSILAAENHQQITRFLAEVDDAEEFPIAVNWGCPMLHGRTILPGENGMDGFYYARLRKKR